MQSIFVEFRHRLNVTKVMCLKGRPGAADFI
jgi:hypothetical protein